VLHNPIGHFDILPPLGGCGKGLVLPSVTGRHGWLVSLAADNQGDDGAEILSPSSHASMLPSQREFYSKQIEKLSQADLVQWQEEFPSSASAGCDAVTNAGFFNISSSACFGDIVTQGQILQTSDWHNVNFGIRKGQFVVGYVDADEIRGEGAAAREDWSAFDTLISGIVWLVRNGEVFVDESMHPQYGQGEDMRAQTAGSSFHTLLSARTAIGHDKEGRLLMLQVEGETWVRGMSLYEFADFAKELGFVSAINLDGGGSATMTVNHTLVSEPSWKCARVRAFDAHIQSMQRALLHGEGLTPFLPTSSKEQEVDLDGDGFRFCEKPVSSITCSHSMPPPKRSETTSIHPSASPSCSPPTSLSPTHAQSARPTEGSSEDDGDGDGGAVVGQDDHSGVFIDDDDEDDAGLTPLPSPRPSLRPSFVHTSISPSLAMYSQNMTLQLAYSLLQTSEYSYRIASYGLSLALILSLSLNLIFCCCCSRSSSNSASKAKSHKHLDDGDIQMNQNIQTPPPPPAPPVGYPNDGYHLSDPSQRASVPPIDPHHKPVEQRRGKDQSRVLSTSNTVAPHQLVVPTAAPAVYEPDRERAKEHWQASLSRIDFSTMGDSEEENVDNIARDHSTLDENDEEEASETARLFKRPPDSKAGREKKGEKKKSLELNLSKGRNEQMDYFDKDREDGGGWFRRKKKGEKKKKGESGEGENRGRGERGARRVEEEYQEISDDEEVALNRSFNR
jgi:hypothetical protein